MAGIWFWIVLGLILIVLEFLIPGLVVIFLGFGAFFVALLHWTGILENWASSTGVWILSSFIFLLLLRSLFQRYLPGERHKGSTDEDEGIFGAVVEVVAPVNAEDNTGRIKFRGVTWPATCIEGQIQAGEKAKIVFRNDMTWVIEPDDGYDNLMETGEI